MATLQDLNSDCSSDSEDDVDYVPTENICSEDDSNDCVSSDDARDDDSGKKKPARRKRKATTRKKSDPVTEETDQEPQVSAENEKKRVEDLYKSFLDDVKPIVRKPASSQSSPNVSNGLSTAKEDINTANKKVTITEEYEFAGETVTLVKEVDSETAAVAKGIDSVKASLKAKVEEAPAKTIDSSLAPTQQPLKRPAAAAAGGGGLSSIVGALNKKKQKLSTLQKSLLDWNTFKNEQGISEELETHNKGKQGYLERQAFLQRSDLRQFELEKELRLTRRRSQQ